MDLGQDLVSQRGIEDDEFLDGFEFLMEELEAIREEVHDRGVVVVGDFQIFQILFRIDDFGRNVRHDFPFKLVKNGSRGQFGEGRGTPKARYMDVLNTCLRFQKTCAEMMDMNRIHQLPRRRHAQAKGKITVYPEKEIERLYNVGKANGWDTPQIVRDAVTEALRKIESDLMCIAPSDEEAG